MRTDNTSQKKYTYRKRKGPKTQLWENPIFRGPDEEDELKDGVTVRGAENQMS